MTDTKEKLLEAKYFLEHMIENQAEHDAFKYNLSAFLAAFRSVTLIMQTEFNGVLGFNNWYQTQRKRMEKDKKMQLLKDERNISIHQQPVQPRAHVSVSVTVPITLSIEPNIRVIRADGTEERHDSANEGPLPTPAKAETNVQWHWYFNKIPDTDVVTVCKECMSKLENVISACEE